MKTVTIGYTRDDGDFAVIATLNNNDGHMSDADFNDLRFALTMSIATYADIQLQMLERQDAPDYVSLEG